MNSRRFLAAAVVASVAICASAELRISEICPKPNAYDSQNRSPGWIEFYNDGPDAVDLADYQLARFNRGKVAKAPTSAAGNFVSRSVPAGGYTVVYTSEDWPNANSGVVAVYAESAYGGDMMVFPNKINNKKYPLVQLYKVTDTVTNLVDEMIVPVDLPETKTIARVGGSFSAFDPATGVANPDAYTAVTDASAVKSAILPTPTKGAANNYTNAIPYGPNAGPLYGVAHKLSDWEAFASPVSGQDYPVSLAVNPVTSAAEDEIVSVTLLYRCDNGPTNTLALAKGASNATAGQFWTNSIPAADLPNPGKLVRWAAQITDAAGNTWRTPSFRDPNLAYQWYGTMVPNPSLESATLQTFHLFVTGNSVAQMDVDVDNQNLSLVPYNARCDVFDSSTGYYYDNVRIDLRGNTTASFRKKSHGLRFNKSQPLTCTDPLTGTKVKEVRKTSFIAEYSDPALVRQALSYKVFRDAGLDVPFDYPVRLNLNGAFYQLAWHSNRFTDELIEDYYGYDPFGYSFKSVGDLAGTSTAGSKKKVTPDNDVENDFSVLNQFQNLISDVSAVSESFTGDGMDSEIPTISKTVVQKFDLPAWINYLAAARITHECDDVWANLCVYWDVNGTDTWKPLAYDLNQSWGVYYVEAGYTDRSGVIVTNDHFKSHPLFGGLRIRTHEKNTTTCFKTGSRGFECIYQSPKFRRLYLRRLRTLMDEQLKAPGTTKAETPFWTYVTTLQNACYAEDLLDNQKWGYGTGTAIYVWQSQMELQDGIDDLWNNYVVPRREHLFVTHSVTNTAKAIGYGEHLNAGIPLPQSDIATLAPNFSFENFSAYDGLDGDGLVISNANAEAVDMSGWTLTGAIEYTMPAGTVIDANDTITVVTNRKAYISANTASLTDQVIVGNARRTASGAIALADADGTSVAEVASATRTDNWNYLRLYSFDGVTTNASGDVDEWIVLTNISDTVSLDLANVHVVICKTGDAVAKCDFTLASGTIPAGGSIRLEQATVGWNKITNGSIDIAIYDEDGEVVQSGRIVQGDFAAYKNKPGEDPATAQYLVLNTTAHTFSSSDASAEYYFEQPEPEPPPPPVLGIFSAPFTVTGYAGSTPLENFPVLVRLAANSPEAFDYADCAADGSDIRFTDANGDQIGCEIQSWNTSGESLVWVNVPVVTNNASFRMWYGGGNVDNYATNTWSRFVGVWHMDEASGSVADATGHGLTATPMGATADSIAVSGAPTGTGRQTATSAASGYLSVPSYNSFGLGDTFTISGWVKMSACTAYPRIFSRKSYYSDANGWEIEMSSGSLVNFAARGANNPSYSGTFPTSLQDTWAHVVLAYNGTTLNVYQNGALVKTGTINAATDNNLPLSFGCDSDGNETYLQGAFDECRLMGGAASADWVKAEYDQIAAANFLTAGKSSAGDIPTFTVDVEPAYTNASLSVELKSIGEGATAAWVYFAFGTDAEHLPEPALVAAVVSAGWTLSTNFTGLANEATYYYAIASTNDIPGSRTTLLTGSFDTLAFSGPTLAISDAANDPESQNVSVRIASLGGADSCDLYFSYGPSADPLPAYEQVRTGMAVGATFSRLLEELEGGVEYAYSFIATNSMGRWSVETGYFTPGIDFKRPNKNIAEFSRGVKWTVTGYAGTSVLTNFPVLVRLANNSPTGFSYADFYSATGDDLCFLDKDGHGIPHEIDTWNTSGESLVWVTLPTMTNGTEFSMWYRSSKSGSVICADNAWEDYTGVWHLGEGGDGAQYVYDSTTNALTGVTHANSLAVSAGRIGAARRNSTKSGNSAANGRILVSLGDADSPQRAAVDAIVPEFSASLWFSPKANADWSYLIARKGDDALDGWGIQFGHNTAFQPVRIWASLGKNDGAYYRTFSPGSPYGDLAGMNQVAWRKVNVVYGSDGYVDFYYDGGAYHTRQQVPLCGKNFANNLSEILAKNGDADLAIGGMSASGYGSFNGEMDEVRLRKGKDSDDWVKAEYDAVVNAAFLNGGEVVSFIETPKPIASFTLADKGAQFARITGTVGLCGGEATACDIYGKFWPTAEAEPSEWTLEAGGIAEGASFMFNVTGLVHSTAYSYKLKARNNLTSPQDSDVAEGSFTTGGVGVGGVGGERYRLGDDYVHVFRYNRGTGDKSYEFTPPDYITSVQALIVAGGGPGGYRRGGGGGAGGLIYSDDFAMTGGETYTVNVGTGGVASAADAIYGTSGEDSTIFLGAVEVARAIGGGAGGNGNDASFRAGVGGGSGGGSAYNTAAVGAGTAGQGNAGGYGNNYNGNYVGGGGGGAGRAGGSGSGDSPPSGGSGGQGFATDISGTFTYYAGGGGGGGVQTGTSSNLGSPGGGGDGGGGMGGMQVPSGTVNPSFSDDATAGQDGLGGGGGGGSNVEGHYQGANGGAGIVIIRYPVNGPGAGPAEPAISLTSAVCNDEDFTGEVTFRVSWAGVGYETDDVKIIWGYSPNSLIHTNDLASGVIGEGSGSFPLIADKCTVYMRAIAVTAGGTVGLSDETLSFYVNENENATIDASSPILRDVGVARYDGIYAVVTGVVVSAGTSHSDPADCLVRVNLGLAENAMSGWTEGRSGVGLFTLNVTNLNPATEYWYDVEIVDDAGVSAAALPATFTTYGESVLDSVTVSVNQRTYSLSGNLTTIGAGTTHIFVKWGDGEYQEIRNFTPDSAAKTFGTTYVDTWGGSKSWSLICSNSCSLVDGTQSEPVWVTTRSGTVSTSDTATYTWQPVDGDWNGNWEDTAHWSCNKADNPGYPGASGNNATASFANCTAENPVTVTVNGRYQVAYLRYYGTTAASDVTFAGNGTATSQLTAGGVAHNANGNASTIKAGTKVTYRDLTLVRDGDWDMVRGVNTSNLTYRFERVTTTGDNRFCVAAPAARIEFIDSTVGANANSFNFGGGGTVLLIDNSTITKNGGNFHLQADVAEAGRGPMEVVFCGAAPKIISPNFFIYNHANADGGVKVTFEVPKGGYAEAPLQITSTSDMFGFNGSAHATAQFEFAVDPMSPAIRQTTREVRDMVVVSTSAGFNADVIADGIGTVKTRKGVDCGGFKYGVNGEPLAEGAALTTARQILLDYDGQNFTTVIMMQ